MKNCILALLLLASIGASAQVENILGEWKTIDDKTGERRSIVSIYQGSDGLYYGKIYPKDGKLVLRGSLDKAGLLGRNQTWEK